MTTRRLAAILAADVVGFSTMMEKNEEGTASHVRAVRREVIEPKLSAHQGRLVKTTGDGFLAEFASPVEAVRCALSIQDSIAERGEANEGLKLRIGINLGDIIIEDDGDVFGDGVNVAARLEQMADPGGVLISGKIYEEIEGKIDRRFESRGEQQVKNLSRPVRVFAWTSATPPKPEPKALTLPDKPSIAVLPFTNMSGDPEQEYFADGVVEDIITGLSRLRWLFVIARNSSFIFKGRAVDVKEVGRALGVRYVLEGSVRKAGSRVRITGQLIDAETGAHIWAERYDRDLTDIFELQDAITREVVTAIEPNLRAVEVERARTKPTDSLDAYDLYLRALPESYSATEEGFRRCERLLQAAVQRDPTYGEAWGGLADCIGRLVVNGWTDFDEGAVRARDAALRGVDADPENGAVLAAAGWALAIICGSLDQASELVARALRIHPNSAYVRTCCGWVFIYTGEEELALEQFEAARRMSPLDPRAYLTLTATGVAHFFDRRFEEAVRWTNRSLQQKTTHVALRYQAAALSHLGPD
jgi:adenylate cyclase